MLSYNIIEMTIYATQCCNVISITIKILLLYNIISITLCYSIISITISFT